MSKWDLVVHSHEWKCNISDPTSLRSFQLWKRFIPGKLKRNLGAKKGEGILISVSDLTASSTSGNVTAGLWLAQFCQKKWWVCTFTLFLQHRMAWICKHGWLGQHYGFWAVKSAFSMKAKYNLERGWDLPHLDSLWKVFSLHASLLHSFIHSSIHYHKHLLGTQKYLLQALQY